VQVVRGIKEWILSLEEQTREYTEENETGIDRLYSPDL
jgi:hypothetical protein